MPNGLARLLVLSVCLWTAFAVAPGAAAAADVAPPPSLPPAVDRKVDFVREIQPLLKQSCVQCHGHGKAKGAFSLETRESFLRPTDGAPAAVPGRSADSLVVKLVSSSDPDVAMPQKGKRWTPEQVGLLRAWIDQGMRWEPGVTFAKAAPENIAPRPVTLTEEAAAATHPMDGLLAEYFKSKSVDAPAAVVDDATFARRVHLDSVGLLPTPAQLAQFVDDKSPDKRASLVKSLLGDDLGYADHWLTFWNDLLRNDYKGTGFIDGGRKQITGWLYGSLASNKPLDRFVAELVSPKADSSGFVHGILWRGDVNASMTPPMQAAQGVAQVFFGVNLKCASCHDSFVSDWTLADAYSLAAVFSDKPLELVHCDKPTGQLVSARFLYPQIGAIDEKAPRDERLRQFASLITSRQNGRLPRTIVNRLWARLLGRGLVEPLDDMDRPAWSPQILDWLAEDMVAHGYDLRRTIGLILTSRAYQLPSVEPAADRQAVSTYTFRGPEPRRLTAEQFADALSTIAGDWAALPASVEFDFSRGADAKASAGPPPAWIWTSDPVELGVQRSAWASAAAKAADAQKRAEEARQALDAGAPPAAASAAAARAKKAADEASAAAAEADALLRSPERSARLAGSPASADKSQLGLVRHRIVFRKRFTLEAPPDRAYAVIAASQRADVQVNGKGVGPLVSDGRQSMLDLKSALKKGENVIAISVDSHTEKPNVPLEVRQASPWLVHHLNARSGVAFKATIDSAGKTTEIASDDTWRARRAPADNWKVPALDDKPWPAATRLAAESEPVDEGPALPDVAGPPDANLAVHLGPKLAPLVALPTRVGQIRSALRPSDPMQLALDRPNREQITSVRSTLATTIQALEMANGATLDEKLKRVSARLAADASRDPVRWVNDTYLQALSRPPTDEERKVATEALGPPVTPESVADLLWAIAMQPEFQFLR